jgi:hypothetical protein
MQRDQILDRFSALPLLVPDRTDHTEAALLRNTCRRRGVQIGTIDALLAQLCMSQWPANAFGDRDFQGVEHSSLQLWRP